MSKNDEGGAGQGGGLYYMPVVAVPVDLIDPDPEQPRKEFDEGELGRLAGSLATLGQLQPITVVRTQDPRRFRVVFGERRWRAAVRAGLPTVDALILDGPLGRDAAREIQIVENAVRADLNPLDEATAFRALMDAKGWVARELAERIHVHPTTVTRALKLLDLNGPLREGVKGGKVAARTALAVNKVDDEGRRAALTARAVAGRLTATEAEAAAVGPTPATRVGSRTVIPVRDGRIVFELGAHPPGRQALLDAALEAVAALAASPS